MADIFKEIIYANGMQGCTYVEPFSGGAGAALKLLDGGHVERIIVNDADFAVFCFWWSVVNYPAAFIDRIHSVPLTIEEWGRQRAVYRNTSLHSRLDVGFATFYLNRCNRSGIIKNGGPIGGVKQAGEWKIDARFNRVVLSKRVAEIAEYGERIVVLNQDAARLIWNLRSHCDTRVFIYADPPYYEKGRELYLNHYGDSDHLAFSQMLQSQRGLPWVVTYDNTPRIRELYATAQRLSFTLRYSTHTSSSEGCELLIAPDSITIPEHVKLMLGAGGFLRSSTDANGAPSTGKTRA